MYIEYTFISVFRFSVLQFLFIAFLLLISSVVNYPSLTVSGPAFEAVNQY